MLEQQQGNAESGVDGSGREKAVQSSRKGLHGCRELQVVPKGRTGRMAVPVLSGAPCRKTSQHTVQGRVGAMPFLSQD